MASPIRWFRKHSQFFVVVFGVVLMAIFGLGSIMTSLNPGDFARNAQAENPVVMEWSGGDLTEYDLFGMRQKHFASIGFLENVYKYAVEQNKGEGFPVSAERILPIVRPGENPSNNDLDQRMWDRYLFAQRAKQEGFIVDEAMVYQYIRQFGGETPLSKQNLKELNKEVNNSVQLAGVVRHLQMELLSQQMENMVRGGLAFDTLNQVAVSAISPTEAIELYARANRKIECRVLPISVADEIANVGEPSGSELSDLYEQGKYDFKSYKFDTPGFKQSKMARVQYFAGELETFLQNEMAKVTNEELQAEYDRLVEAEDNLVMQLIPKSKPETTPDTSEESGTEEPESSDDPAPAPGDEAEGETTPEAETTPDGETNESEAEGTGSSGGYTSIGFQEEGEENQESTEETPAESAQPEAIADSEEMAAQEPTEADTSDQESNEATSGDEAGADDAEMKKEDMTDSAAQDDTVDPVIEDEKPKREPKPLAEVADQIKRKLKMFDARKARDEVMDQAEKELRKYQMTVNK